MARKNIIIFILLFAAGAAWSIGSEPKNQISSTSSKALEILYKSDLSRFYNHESFEIKMLDFQAHNEFKDESESFKEWLIGSPIDNSVILEFSKREDKFFEFASGNEIWYVLWFYPGLVGEPPVIKFEGAYNPTVIAGSIGEFVCQLITDTDSELETYAEPSLFDFNTKILLKDYSNFKKRVSNEIGCAAYKNHKEQMTRHPILSAPITFEKIPVDLNGEDIIKLIGLPMDDNRVLSTLLELNYEIPLFATKDRGFWTEDSKGLALEFRPNNDYQRVYLESIAFNMDYDFLPFGIDKNDNLDAVERKIGKKANFIDVDREENPYLLYWIYEDLGYVWVQFDNSNYTGIWDISAKQFKNPEKDSGLSELIAPFKK